MNCTPWRDETGRADYYQSQCADLEAKANEREAYILRILAEDIRHINQHAKQIRHTRKARMQRDDLRADCEDYKADWAQALMQRDNLLGETQRKDHVIYELRAEINGMRVENATLSETDRMLKAEFDRLSIMKLPEIIHWQEVVKQARAVLGREGAPLDG